VTVFRNGFQSNAYASFPTGAEPSANPVLQFSVPPAAAPRLRAYDLRIIGSIRPQVRGTMSFEDAALRAERRETSVVVENLEPGLRYTWRLRFKTPSGEERASALASCVAPVCPADMAE
jgi:hypothetical protein